jgi:catechol 2,3-dioxygenase-like lactoylglutathione lyase family enzyme
MATNADAPPPKPLNAATSCGIDVISTFWARNAPIEPPTTMPAIDRPVADDLLVEQRHHDRDQHAQRCDPVAVLRGGGRGEALEADDEQDGGEQVQEPGGCGVHAVPPRDDVGFTSDLA